MAWTYMLECGDGSIYVGSTRYKDVYRRVWEHQNGYGGKYTSKRRPVKLIWSMRFDTVQEAWGYERKLHGWGRAKRLALANGEFDKLPELSRSRTSRSEAS